MLVIPHFSTFFFILFFFSGLYEIIFTPGNEGERTGQARHTPRFERRKWKDEGKIDIKFPRMRNKSRPFKKKVNTPNGFDTEKEKRCFSSNSFLGGIIDGKIDRLRILHDGRRQTLGVLDVDGLHVRVQLLLGALLVVTLAADAHTQTEGNTLDTGFPDLLVQLGVEADVLGALKFRPMLARHTFLLAEDIDYSYHGMLSESADLLDGAGSTLLEGDTVHLR
jgi:hypothetical protein